MKQKYIALVLMVIGILAASFFIFSSQKDGRKQKAAESELGFKSINANELRTMLENKDFKLINVHIP